jgi:type II secretory pathway component PulF
MPKFDYTALSIHGAIQKGTLEADSEARLRSNLAQLDLEVISVKQRLRGLERRRQNYRLKTSELASMIFQLGMQLKAGVPLLSALRLPDEDGKPGKDAPVRQRLAEVVEEGSPISRGMKEFPRVFPNYVCNVVKVAERSGALSENLIEMRDYLEWMDRNWKSFRQAMIYPSCVMLALIAFIIIALRFVFPSITGILFELNVPLPWITKAMISASDFVQNHWWLILATGFFLPIGFRLLFKYSAQAARTRDRWLLDLPFLGDVILNLAVNRFLRSLILMLQAGIVITEALELSREVVGNREIEASLLKIETAVANGTPMSDAMRRESVFPGLVLSMVAVGERSGSMDESLQSVVDYYDDLVPRKIKAFFAILEPLLIVVTITLAGLVAAAVFLPLVNMLSPGAY